MMAKKQLVILCIIFVVVAAGALTAILTHGSSKEVSQAGACVNRTYKAGSSGQCVSDLQNLANWAAYGIDGPRYIKVTGSYGPSTTAAVKTFQSNFGLTVTGVVTPKDWHSLCNSEGGPPSWWTKSAKQAGC